MAAPSVTKVFALWQQYYKHLYPTRVKMRAATVKALMAISADEAGAADGPDHRFGWGLINAKRGAEILRDSKTGDTEVRELELVDGSTYELKVVTDGTMPLKAAIAWTDPAGSINSGNEDDDTPSLVNDLDLRIIRPNDDVVMPWALTRLQWNNIYAERADNFVDPIEVVEYKGSASGVAGAGEYTIRVTHKGTLTNGSQNFSLIIYGMKEGLSVKKESFDNLNVYPNPATDVVNISADLISIVDAKVELYDMAGKRVYENSGLFNNTDKASVDMSSLDPGVYLLKLETDKKKQTIKIVKR